MADEKPSGHRRHDAGAAGHPGTVLRRLSPEAPGGEAPGRLPREKRGFGDDHIQKIGYLLYLVGGLEHQWYFPINIGNLIIPIDVHIFQRGSNHQPGTCIEIGKIGLD